MIREDKSAFCRLFAHREKIYFRIQHTQKTLLLEPTLFLDVAVKERKKMQNFCWQQGLFFAGCMAVPTMKVFFCMLHVPTLLTGNAISPKKRTGNAEFNPFFPKTYARAQYSTHIYLREEGEAQSHQRKKHIVYVRAKSSRILRTIIQKLESTTPRPGEG